MNKITNKIEFWNEIVKDKKNYTERLYELLSARGFFLEHRDNNIYVLDNNHIDDFDYLDEMLKKLNIGNVEILQEDVREVKELDRFETGGFRSEYVRHVVRTGIINIKNEVDLNNIIDNLLIIEQIKMVCVSGGINPWWYALERENGAKVPVKVLETYVSRFTRALSSCGLNTARSCDGNHKGPDRVWIDFDFDADEIFYKAICKHILNKRFNISFGFEIPYNSDNQYSTYYDVNMAGKYLFENRERFRGKKYKFYTRYTDKYLKNEKNYETLKQEYTKYLDDELIDWKD